MINAKDEFIKLTKGKEIKDIIKALELEISEFTLKGNEIFLLPCLYNKTIIFFNDRKEVDNKDDNKGE